VGKESVQILEARSGHMGGLQRCCSPLQREILAAKAQLKFKRVSAVKANKKGFLKYVNSKRSIRDNIGLLLDVVGHLTNREVDTTMPSLTLPSTPMIGPGIPGALCWKTVEKVIMGVIEKHFRDSAVVSHSQHRFMRCKSCLTNLMSFYDKVTHPSDQGKSVDVVFLDLIKLLRLPLSVSFWTKCTAYSQTSP